MSLTSKTPQNGGRHYGMKFSRNPIRDRNVLYTGVADYEKVLETGFLPMEETETDVRAICMSRNFDMAMSFANKAGSTGGVLALDRDLLRTRYKTVCHQDLLLCYQYRSKGYSEAEERIYSDIDDIGRYVLGSWEASKKAELIAQENKIRACEEEKENCPNAKAVRDALSETPYPDENFSVWDFLYTEEDWPEITVNWRILEGEDREAAQAEADRIRKQQSILQAEKHRARSTEKEKGFSLYSLEYIEEDWPEISVDWKVLQGDDREAAQAEYDRVMKQQAILAAADHRAKADAQVSDPFTGATPMEDVEGEGPLDTIPESASAAAQSIPESQADCI